MKGLENQEYLLGFLASNIIALLFILIAIKLPRIGRLLFFILFSWACWINRKFSNNDPCAFQEYAELTFLDVYKDFISGCFRQNTSWVVAGIATCQGMIAIAMLLKGRIYKLACTGGIIFFLAIIPLGGGSGSPSTLSFAIALFILSRRGKEYLWKRSSQTTIS
jgi:hypothetical protein